MQLSKALAAGGQGPGDVGRLGVACIVLRQEAEEEEKAVWI